MSVDKLSEKIEKDHLNVMNEMERVFKALISTWGCSFVKE
jgi:hypothetical protein